MIHAFRSVAPEPFRVPAHTVSQAPRKVPSPASFPNPIHEAFQ